MPNRLGTGSLSAKLALLMTSVVFCTVIALTVQSANKFSEYILQNIEESSTNMAERAAGDVSAIIESWFAQMAVTVSKLPAAPNGLGKTDEALAAGLRANSDILASGLYVISEGNVSITRQALQQTAPQPDKSRDTAKISDLKNLMDDIAKQTAKNQELLPGGRIVKNVTPTLKTPTILLGLKLGVTGQDSKFALMIVIADMTKIQVALPQSRHTTGFIVDYIGTMFAATDESKVISSAPIKGNQLVQKALTRRAPSGFTAKFLDSSGKEKIGSFAQIPGNLPLFVVIERDRDAAFQVITRMYITAALWGLLIMLFAGMASIVSAGTITKNLRDLVTATKRIAAGDFGVRLQPHSNDEVALLGHSVNNMAGKIQFLMSAEVEKARFEKELETARMVQSTFFPKRDITKSHLNVTGSYQPATECGGDLWGHYSIKENVEFIFIADAMGHGAPAALVTAIAYAVCQSVSSILSENQALDPSPAKLLKRLNSIIIEAVDGKISMTFFGALIDFNTGKMTFANAGHNFPVILTANREDPRLGSSAKKNKNSSELGAISLTLQGNPLGVDKNTEFKEKTINLSPGDKIFMFTDGLLENSFKGNPPLSRKGLIEFVCKAGFDSVSAIRRKVEEKGESIYGSENLSDDVTIVIAEISKDWVPKPQAPSFPPNELAKSEMPPSISNSTSNVSPASFVPPPPPAQRPIRFDIAQNSPDNTPAFDLSAPASTTNQIDGIDAMPVKAPPKATSALFDLSIPTDSSNEEAVDPNNSTPKPVKSVG